jgi:D-serine deaminase-like pyridoxal phosphate-dependent protein
MDTSIYRLSHPNELVTPVLLYYKDYIRDNIKKAIAIAGDPDRLWPHVKTHKTRELILLLIEQGVTHFKCATISEAEMVASCHPTDIILAYPLVGPNISRFLALQHDFPQVRFWAIGDNLDQVKLLGAAAVAAGTQVRFLADVNVGQDRTGVAYDNLISFYQAAAAVDGISPDGFHCYDGHIHQPDFQVRTQLADEIFSHAAALRDQLKSEGHSCSTLVMGGTPTFPCYAKHPGIYLSPGTVFLSDYSYSSSYEEMDFLPAGILMTRVVSRPTPSTFTLDLGNKGIAADPAGVRGVIVGMEEITTPLFQNEEHWVFQVSPGHEDQIPPVGSEVYVMPTHICPCSALYPYVPIIEGGEVTGHWDIAARNRKITY